MKIGKQKTLAIERGGCREKPVIAGVFLSCLVALAFVICY